MMIVVVVVVGAVVDVIRILRSWLAGWLACVPAEQMQIKLCKVLEEWALEAAQASSPPPSTSSSTLATSSQRARAHSVTRSYALCASMFLVQRTRLGWSTLQAHNNSIVRELCTLARQSGTYAARKVN